jgi:catecholate siderophore receptor
LTAEFDYDYHYQNFTAIRSARSNGGADQIEIEPASQSTTTQASPLRDPNQPEASMSRPLSVNNRRARRYWSAGRVARVVAVACALLGGSVAYADEPAKSEKPEEITVTGKENRNPYNPDNLSLDRLKSLKKTQSVTVVPQILLEQQGATTLKDALRNVSGIGLSAGEGGVQGDDFTLRGYNAKTDIFIDGVRDQGSYQRDSFNLQSVEVVKGPSSSYFGRGSTGGVVNQVSKTAREGNSYAGIVSSGMGPFNRAQFDVNQQLSESVAVRFNVIGQKSEIVDRDESEQKRYGYASSLVFGLDQPTQLTLNYLFQEENNTPDYGVPYVGGEPARVDRDTFYGARGEDFEKTKINVATMRLDHQFNDQIELHNTTRFSHVDRAAAPTSPRLCVAGAATLTAGCPFETVAGTRQQLAGLRRNRPERDARETILSNQTDLRFEFATGGIEHSLGTGVEIAREEFRLTRFTDNGTPSLSLDPNDLQPGFVEPPRVRSQRTNTRALSVGAFVADELRLTEQFDLILGVRWDYFGASFNDEFPIAGPPGTTRPDFDSSDRNVSYKAGIAYHPTPTQNYYASFGTSFNPSAEALALNGNNAGTDPEKNRTFEIGGKIDLRDGNLSLQGAIFNIEKTDARETDPGASTIMVLEGERLVRGFELSVNGRVADGWVMFGSYTFLDSEITETLEPEENGKDVQRVPRHSATIWNSYQFPGQKVEIGGGPTYVSHRYADDANTNKVKGYVRWDATIGYAVTEKVSLRLNLQNITDKEYFESAGGGHALPAPGRTAIASVSFNF